MYYEINVSMNQRHVFATAKRSLTSEQEMLSVYNMFKDKFPASEGYKVDVRKIETYIYDWEI